MEFSLWWSLIIRTGQGMYLWTRTMSGYQAEWSLN